MYLQTLLHIHLVTIDYIELAADYYIEWQNEQFKMIKKGN